MIVLSTKETAAQFPTNPNGYVNAIEFVGARYVDDRAEERKAKPGYGKRANWIVTAIVDGKRKAIGPACGDKFRAYRKAAERLGWHELMTPPKVKAGDLFKAHIGPRLRAMRVFWSNDSLSWIVEYDTDPASEVPYRQLWTIERRFLDHATPLGENVDAWNG